MVFNWNDEKNEYLKRTRNIGFEEIVVSIENGGILDILENPSPEYKKQIIIIVNYENYAYVVPATANNNEFFFKTIFPSRKYTKIYLKDREDK